jgi:hypothetical protein
LQRVCSPSSHGLILNLFLFKKDEPQRTANMENHKNNFENRNHSNEIPTNPIDSVPNDILCHIFSFLDTLRDLAVMRQVSKRFLEVSSTDSLWAKFDPGN